MQYHMPDQEVRSESWMVFCPECSQKMRVIMAAPAQDGKETRTYECAYGHREAFDVAFH
jgi:lysyl-tRNA synthetase class I